MTLDDRLSATEKAEARKIFEGKVDGVTSCLFCGGIHARVTGVQLERQPCPRLNSVEWHADGTLLRVVYWPNGSWENDVIFPGDVYDEDDDEVTDEA